MADPSALLQSYLGQSFRDRRTCAIAVRRGSYQSLLLLLISGLFSLENKANSVLNFG